MSKISDHSRVTRGIQRYGVSTIEEVLERYEISKTYLHTLLTSPKTPITRAPKFLVANPGQYVYWTPAQNRGEEVKNLLAIINHLAWQYQLTHHIRYKKYCVLAARKLIALSFDIFFFVTFLNPAGKLPAKSDEDKDTKKADYYCTEIQRALSSGQVRFKDKAESSEDNT